MKPRAIHWSQQAADEFDQAVSFLRAQNPRAAPRMVEDTNRALGRLSRRNTARIGRVPGTFEQPLLKWKHILAFEIRTGPEGEGVYILHVIHMARDWPAGRWPDKP